MQGILSKPIICRCANGYYCTAFYNAVLILTLCRAYSVRKDAKAEMAIHVNEAVQRKIEGRKKDRCRDAIMTFNKIIRRADTSALGAINRPLRMAGVCCSS